MTDSTLQFSATSPKPSVSEHSLAQLLSSDIIRQMSEKLPVQFSDIEAAARRIKGRVHETPLISSASLASIGGYDAFMLKCENFQKAGVFKVRGALNAVAKLKEDFGGTLPADTTIVTHSSGNHAQAVAMAAQSFGCKAHVVIPENAPKVKLEAVRDTYLAEITMSSPTQKERERVCRDVMQEVEKKGGKALYVSPSSDPLVIAGQGTIGIEIVRQGKILLPEVLKKRPQLKTTNPKSLSELGKKEKENEGMFDAVIVPVGGGGLMAGVALAIKALSPKTLVIAAEPENVDDASRSFAAKQLYTEHRKVPIKTIADGLLMTLSQNTFDIMLECVDEVVTVSEREISLGIPICLVQLPLIFWF